MRRWAKRQPESDRRSQVRRPQITQRPIERPVYSYYARSSRSEILSPASRVAGGSPEKKQSRAEKRTQNRVFSVAYGLIGIICIVKVLMLTPSSKVVLPDTVVGQPATQAYALETDRLLRSSALNRTKLTLNANGIAAKLQQTFPELQEVVLTVPVIGNRPVLHVLPTTPVMVLNAQSGLYTIDSKGYVLSRLSEPLSEFAMLQEESARRVTPGKQYIAGSTVKFARTIVHELNAGGFTVTTLKLPGAAPYEIQANISGKPFYVRFNLQADAMQQCGGAVAILKQLGTSQPSQYLDMRVPGRAYYR